MKLLKIREVANILRCSDRAVRRYCSDGVIEGAFKIGKCWLIPDESVNTLIGNESRKKWIRSGNQSI